jgi:4-methyl-5(b-hydroxyethyl)-thiazole monophosphate biosynthesis
MAKVLVPIAPGFEEIEAVTVIDILRRAGITVVVAGLCDGTVTGSHKIGLETDCNLDEVMGEDFDMAVLPGGMPGADNLRDDPRVIGILKTLAAEGKFITAICAAPQVLAAAGLLDNRRATSYPGFLDPGRVPGLEFTEAVVEQDGKVITSRGPGTAMDFALALVENLAGKDRRDELERNLQRPALTLAGGYRRGSPG